MQSGPIKRNETQSPQEEALADVLAVVSSLLMDRKPRGLEALDPRLLEDPQFQKLYTYLTDLRDLTEALCKGELSQEVDSKGYMISNLKAMQSNLRHLSWQTERIAQGDFTQKVDFLGDFSKSFNQMVDQLARMTGQMRRLASTDALTKVPNRLSLEQFFEMSFARCKSEGHPLSALFIDIDHFKQVNDTYGHPVGDQVLVAVSEVLQTQFRSSDMFARFGGEEFIAVLPATSLSGASQLAERTLKAVENLRIPLEDGETLSVTVSIGASEIQPNDENYFEIIRRMDEAMYQAKKSGRNCICYQ